MNHTYSIVYNAALGEYQVVSEKTKTRRSKARKLLPIILASLLAPVLAVDINDGENAINVSAHSAAQWADYIFKTTNPIDADNGTEKFGFAAWSQVLDAYVRDPNNPTTKSAWEMANTTLKDNVANYFAANKGFLHINEDKTFTLTASTTQRTEKEVKAGELVAISVGKDKKLTYELNNPLATPKPKDEPEHTSRLFKIEKNGTLIMIGNKGSSIIIKGFKVNTNDTTAYGGAIYNAGNVFLGDNVILEGNKASSSFSYGGAIHNNGGTFSLGNNAKFQGNTVAAIINAIVHTNVAANAFTSASGGGIYNSGTIALGNNIKFKGNAATVTTYVSVTTSSDTDINADVEAEANGGAIHNNNITTLGNNVSFIQNNAIADATVIIKNSGTVVTANPLVAANAKANAFGGAINNKGTFTLGNKAIFIANTVAATAGASSASTIGTVTGSVNANAYGGAINNNGIFTLGADAQFIKNEAQSYRDVFGGAINNNGTFNLATGDLNDVTLFTGNLANNKANSIHQDGGTFNITGDGILDMRDPFSGAGTFNKSGNGVWKLGGDNTTGSLNINAGTLYLYVQDEVDNANKNDAKAKVGLGNLTLTGQFTLASGTVLSLGGQGHIIIANSVHIKGNTIFRFNLGAAQLNTPILTWDAKSIGISGDWNKVDIQTLAKNNGTYTLIHGLGSNTFNQNSLYIRGESIIGTLLNSVYELNGTTNKLTLNVTKVINNEEVTWNGASDQWNMTDKNWDGRAEKQYLLGDKVVFNEHGNNKNITINAGGVVVSDMVVSGGAYKFSGGVIETTANILGTKITNPQQKLTIEGGAKVDFTGIAGKNNFAGGVFLDKGTLSVSTLNQLGTNLSKMTFGTGAILDFKDSFTIDGQDGSDQRFVVGDTGIELEIKIADGKTLTFKNNNAPSSGGAIINVGKFTLGGDATFTGNTSPYGGAIYNSKNLILGGDFTLRGDATFTGNTASVSGGAIFNTGKFTVGGDANFTGNTSSYNGGAIFNFSTFTLGGDETLFSGNLANGKANSIHQDGGTFNITGNGTLDMRDPFSGQGSFNKSGRGVWKLGGDNTTTNLNINEGSLYLYAKDEEENGNRLDATARVTEGNIIVTNMTLGTANNGATLFANGGNKLSGDTLTLYSGSTFGFKVGQNTPAMTWNFKNNIKHEGYGQYTFAILNATGVGKYHLLSSTSAHGFDKDKLKWDDSENGKITGRLKTSIDLEVTLNDIYLNYSQAVQNAIATWNNANQSVSWDDKSNHWNINVANHNTSNEKFLDKDQVVFGKNSHQQTIDIANTVVVGDMTVDSGDYKFTGKGITTDKTGVGLSNPTEKLMLTNGAKVDFTEITGTNKFTNGIDISHGALTVSKKEQLGTDFSGVKFGAQGTLNLDIADKNAFDAKGSLSGLGTVNKQGAGTWLLDANSVNSMNALNVEAGTLSLGNTAEITSTTMTLGTINNGAALLANGGNKLSGDQLTLHSGSTFEFKISKDHFIDASTNSANDSVMHWDFTGINHVGNQQYTVDVSPLIYDVGRYHLLSSQNAHGFDLNNLTLTYLGHDPKTIERIKNTFFLNQDAKNIYLEYGKLNNNGIATWTGSSHLGKWNVADENWSVQIGGQQGTAKTFIAQDHVIFGQNANQQIIDITHDVIVAGMDVTEGDYKFTGRGISTSNAGVGLSNITEQLSIQNGAKVDFTGITGINKFANGIDIVDGALTVSHKKQLGTDLSGVKLSTQGTLNLDIAVNDHFDAAGTLSGAGTVNKKGAGTWQLNGINSVDAFNLQAGALNLGHNAEITANTMTLGLADQHSTLMIQSSNKLSGDTLHLNSGGAKGSTTFSMALSADNLVTGANIAAMNWDFKTIHNDGGNYIFDITKMTSGVGQYRLLSNSHKHGFNQQQLKFSYAGFDPNSIERLKDVFKLSLDATQVYLDYSQILPNGTATWVNTNSSAIWNVADKNWSVAIPNYSALSETFLNQDAVVFGDQGLTEQSININAAGAEFEVNGMAVNANTNYTFNGDGLKLMAGTEITKQGNGMLAFNNTVISDVDLQGGSLIIGASSQNKSAKLSGDVVAQSDTTLGGHGTIEGIATLNQGATLSPGNSIGTLTVGELNLQNGSKVVLDTAPNGDNDKIIAKKLTTATGTTSGNITIGQNVTLDIVAGAGQWSPSTSYNFMTAEGVMIGAFSNVTTNLAFLTPKLAVGSNGTLQLVMNRNDIVLGSIATTYNQRSTANVIDTLSHGHAVYDAVVSMSDDQARLAYDNLSGELYASTENALFQNANRLHDGMLNRIHENSTGLWLNGWGYNGEIKGDGNAAKVENKGSGLLLGYDWAMKENILIGAALGYEESKIKIKEHNRKSENSVKSTHFMVYGNVDLDVIELKVGLNYSALRYKGNRDINIPTLVGTANAKYRGHQVHAFVEASKTFNITENYDVAPYLNVGYTEIKAKSFTETGSKAALQAKGQSNNRTSITLGVKNDWYLGTDKNLAITADLGWKHTFGDQTIDKRFNFVGSDQSFNIKSASINRNSAVVGLGIKGQYNDLTVDVGYQGEFNNKVKDHALSAKLKWSF